VLYAVRNEIVHVQFPTVMRFPRPQDDSRRSGANVDYVALPKAVNGGVRDSFN
jgi:hypothetical protein